MTNRKQKIVSIYAYIMKQTTVSRNDSIIVNINYSLQITRVSLRFRKDI